jgi:hypothetical protein
MGNLIIKVDNKEVYNKKYCCASSGSVWFGKEWDAHVEAGELEWKDANDFDNDIRNAVRDVLERITVCCGGCI